MANLIQGLRAWGRKHKNPLLLLLLGIFLAEVGLGVYVTMDRMAWEAAHPPSRGAGLECGPAGCRLGALEAQTSTFVVPGLCAEDSPLQEDLYAHEYRDEMIRRQMATATMYNLTATEAAAVVPYMGDWEGGPTAVWMDWGAFTPRAPKCVPLEYYHPEEYRLGP